MAALVDVLCPTGRLSTLCFNVGVVLAGAGLLSLAAQIAIPLGFTPVPFTCHTLVVLFMGGVLGARRGTCAVILYLMEGVSGLPVFAQGHYGLAHLLGPSGGYLLGFCLATFLIGSLLQEKTSHFKQTIWVMGLGMCVIYLFGALWLSHFVGFSAAIQLGVIPFLISDALKVLLAASLMPAGWKLLHRVSRD